MSESTTFPTTDTWEETIRTARSILDPEEAPRALFVGLFHANGTDFSMGVNDIVVQDDGETAERASVEVLAAHLSTLSERYGTSVESIAERGVEVANE